VTAASKGLPASVQVRLVQHAKAIGLDPNLVLARYGTERFLYRLSRSPYSDRFVLKGALLMLVWLGETIRPTRDADLLGFGDLSQESLAQILKDICAVQVEPDGLQYLISSVDVSAIREADAYGGLRGTVQARLGNARLRVQIDVGIGDAVVPPPEWLEYPSLLGFPPPRLRVYRPETAIAEKLHAMVELGKDNSRMRDFFDIYALAAQRGFSGDTLVAAVRATFERRRTPIPEALPLALTAEFATLGSKLNQWRGFVRKSGASLAPREFDQVITTIARFLEPVIGAVRAGTSFNMTWAPGGAWLPDRSARG
jgi:predicted nucleotidyltransferase component of viral defense system